jgi:hypothetical protein
MPHKVDLTQRLGAMYGGVEDIKKLKYFSMSTEEWTSMAAKQVPSPYMPKVKHAGDTDNFDRYQEEDIRWCVRCVMSLLPHRLTPAQGRQPG